MKTYSMRGIKMNIDTIVIILEIASLLLPIFVSLYKILTLHIKNSTKIDMIIKYLETHEDRLQKLEQLILELSKGVGKQ